ncbi:carboxypeptidase-like regulatory domain-containing protein [Granulicella sp. L60]|uniref:carboxypeptidase-like regulatory domain-containing protein n=1 Tax=Granulicella sp. L60 TaxID=1641866 RepID=UPI00131E5D6D|nr:carboxypeptidase-like regulatory domain-containing protein [Granulicella sp. L60]
MKARGLAQVLATAGLLLFAAPLSGQPTVRNLTGTVQDRHHEPLKGAIVEIENEDTKGVVSYITDRNGRYSFKRLEGEADYRIWFTYRGHRSKIRQLSQFDGRHDATINLVIKEY